MKLRSRNRAGSASALNAPAICSAAAWLSRPCRTGGQQAEIEATGLQPTNDFESAIVMTLLPAPYTAIVRGKNDTTGVALVEVYNLN